MSSEGGTVGGISNADLLSMQKQSGDGGGSGAGPKVNEDDPLNAAANSASRLFSQVFKSLLGFNPEGAGTTPIFAGLDTEGLAGKSIPGLLPNLKGGVLAQMLYDIFVKNSKVDDHTHGVGGNLHAVDGGDFSSASQKFAGVVMDIAPVSEANLMDFKPMQTPGIAANQGAGLSA